MFLWMPDSPLQARYLTDQDKLIAIERLRSSESRITTREWQHGQFLEAMRDIKTWLWVAMIFCISVPSNGISTFGPLIIESFVSDPFQTMLFNVPVGVSHIIAVTGSAYIAMKCKTKAYVIVGLCIPPLIGFGVLLMFPHDIHHRAILLVGYFCLSAYTGISKYRSHEEVTFRAWLTTCSAAHLFLVSTMHRWRHQEKDSISIGLHRVFCWQYYRPTTVHTRRGSRVPARHPSQHCLLHVCCSDCWRDCSVPPRPE